VIYRSIPDLADYWQKHESQAKQIAINLCDRLAFAAHGRTQSDCNSFFSAVKGGIGQFGDGHSNYVELLNSCFRDSGDELKSVSRAFEDKVYIRRFSLSSAKPTDALPPPGSSTNSPIPDALAML
jgi:hypothetical protein